MFLRRKLETGTSLSIDIMSYTSYKIVGATTSYFKKLQGILVMDHRPNNSNYEVYAKAKCFSKI